MILLKKKFGDTIYQKIFSLIVLSGLFFFALFFSIFYYTVQQEEEVYEKTTKQFDNEVSSLIKLNTHTNVSNIVDMVYWDEFQNYLITKDSDWFEQNIILSLETYTADYLGIYDINGNFVRKHSNDKIKAVDFIPKGVFKLLDKKKLLKFYIELPDGFAEVYAATVHPSSDINIRITKPSGYFFIVRLYDKSYFQPLERLTNSTIGFQTATASPNEDTVVTTRDLNGWNGATLRKLTFERPFNVSFQTTKNILYILIFTYLINVLTYLIYSRRWVYKPLKLITNILERVNERDMRMLKNVPGEFKYISLMFKENNEQRKMLEIAKTKAEENDRLKSSFLTNISHEIRTPINAIAGFSDLLLCDQLSKVEQREYAEIIKKSGANLVSIIDDLIEMSKIDTNQVQPNYTVVDINSCLNELYTTIKILIPEEKDIKFNITPPDNPITMGVITDAVKLRQVLTNLITNSIKYTESGFVTFGYNQNGSGEIEFKVQDSGIGIDKEQQPRIFDRFHRVDNEFTIKAGGLGLGLAISKAYVQMLGGQISLAPGAISGTTFIFTIPANLAAESKPVLPKVRAEEPVLEEKAITILIAEDNNINFLLMQKILSNMNLKTILRATDGIEAVEQCRANPKIDLVLMDIKMPGLDGYEAFDRIKVFRPDLPVIAQTAYSSSEDEAKIMVAGFHGYISKPINKEKLIVLMKETIKSKYSDLC